MQGLKIKVDSSSVEELIQKLNQTIKLINELKELLDADEQLKKMLNDDWEAIKKGEMTINEIRKKHGLGPLPEEYAGDERLTVMKKEIKDMTEKEILRQQLELLAETSLNAEPEELVRLSSVMAELLKIDWY